jgi:acetylornithine deacetylase/succinyl-diaminopimelate desuccinylase-like protein
LVVSLTPDEETGGAIGTGYLMENKLIPLGIGMIMPEPTSGQVWDSCRGAITLEIMVKGKPAHSAQQHKGVNAFEKSIDLLYRLLAYKKIVETRRTELKISSEDSPHSIMMIGGICSSGNNFNVVPSEFKFSIDRRVNPEEKVELELEAIKNICRECEKEWFPIDIKILQQGDSVSPFKERRLGTILHQTISEYTGKIPDFVMCPGLLEIRHFVKAGIEAYAYGPGLLKQAHSSEESVKISEIQDTTGIFIQTALTMIERNYIF